RPGAMPAGFAAGRGEHPSRYPGLSFEMARSGGDFVQTAIRATPGGAGARSRARIDLVYGNGGGLHEGFFTWHHDRLFELPVVWLHPLGRWAHISLDRYGQGDFGRPTTPRCLECHNTWVGHVPGTTNQYLRDHLLLGVTCERCHGPGR